MTLIEITRPRMASVTITWIAVFVLATTTRKPAPLTSSAARPSGQTGAKPNVSTEAA